MKNEELKKVTVAWQAATVQRDSGLSVKACYKLKLKINAPKFFHVVPCIMSYIHSLWSSIFLEYTQGKMMQYPSRWLNEIQGTCDIPLLNNKGPCIGCKQEIFSLQDFGCILLSSFYFMEILWMVDSGWKELTIQWGRHSWYSLVKPFIKFPSIFWTYVRACYDRWGRSGSSFTYSNRWYRCQCRCNINIGLRWWILGAAKHCWGKLIKSEPKFNASFRFMS